MPLDRASFVEPIWNGINYLSTLDSVVKQSLTKLCWSSICAPYLWQSLTESGGFHGWIYINHEVPIHWPDVFVFLHVCDNELPGNTLQYSQQCIHHFFIAYLSFWHYFPLCVILLLIISCILLRSSYYLASHGIVNIINLIKSDIDIWFKYLKFSRTLPRLMCCKDHVLWCSTYCYSLRSITLIPHNNKLIHMVQLPGSLCA